MLFTERKINRKKWVFLQEVAWLSKKFDNKLYHLLEHIKMWGLSNCECRVKLTQYSLKHLLQPKHEQLVDNFYVRKLAIWHLEKL